MKEIKSTIVGMFLIFLGSFFFYSHREEIVSNNYILYGCFSLIGFGIYLVFSTTDSRKKHFIEFLNIVKYRIGGKK